VKDIIARVKYRPSMTSEAVRFLAVETTLIELLSGIHQLIDGRSTFNQKGYIYACICFK
jgi:hypothetical protein